MLVGRQVRRRAFRLWGLFFLAGFRQHSPPFVLEPIEGDLDRDGQRLQIAEIRGLIGIFQRRQ